MDDPPPCSCARKHDGGDLLKGFAAIRECCPLLTQLLLPDAIWPEFQKAAAAPPDDALHQSILVLAFDRGHLDQVTTPLHRHLIDEGKLRAGLRKQYLNDLREEWLFETDLLSATARRGASWESSPS